MRKGRLFKTSGFLIILAIVFVVIGSVSIIYASSGEVVAYYDGNSLYSDEECYNEVTDTSDITKVIVKDGVTTIGDNAFKDFSSLTSIEIPGSVTSIGTSAFSGCSSLKSIEIPSVT